MGTRPVHAAHREACGQPHREQTFEEVAREVQDLARRVEVLERALAPNAAGLAYVAPDLPPPVDRRQRPGRVDPAARVRAIEMALAGYSRDAIARELGASMAPEQITGLLDEVLSR